MNISNLVVTESTATTCRIESIHEMCEYRKYSRFFRGKLMKKVKSIRGTTGWYKFINKSDQNALNRHAGWSDRKDVYRLQNPKVK